MTTEDRLAAVHAQYESYPYPARDPKDEAKRLITGSPSHLLEISHYLNRGRLDLTKPFRALVAGGGTGDATIMLAQQLSDAGASDAQVTYLDLSTASRGIAEARAAVRGLQNIRFMTGEIEAVGSLCPGPFDYIDCCGVLHHLADPVAGLEALFTVLAPSGGMGLMVYGEMGRRGVYDVQDAMRVLGVGLSDPARLDMVQRLLDGLPQSHWLRRNPFVGDHFQGGAAALYDLLLHPRDRAYTVDEFLDFVDAGGGRVTSMIAPAQYDPRHFLQDPALIEQAARLSTREGWALAERLSGALTKHIAYVVAADRLDDPIARLDDEWRAAVPSFRDMEPRAVAKGIGPGGELKADLAPGQAYRARLPKLAPEIAARVDGQTSLGRLWVDLNAALGLDLDEEQFLEQYRMFHYAFGDINRLLHHGMEG